MPESTARTKSRSLSREDWVVAAIAAIVSDGADAIRIDRLCEALGVTKGSFYHHFRGREELVDAMATYWSKTQTEGVLTRLGDVSEEPLGKLKELIQVFTDLDIGPRDHAMRALATSEPSIARAVDEADQQVLATMEKILRSLGATPADSRAFARILSFATIGFYTAPNLATKQDTRAILKRLLGMMSESFRPR